MMNDEDAKLRRNLLIVSVTILISSFLQLQSPAILNLISTAIAAPSAEPWKLWLIALLALIYCIGRYHFSQNRRSSYSNWRTESQSAWEEMLTPLIRNESHRLHREMEFSEYQKIPHEVPFFISRKAADVQVQFVRKLGFRRVSYATGYANPMHNKQPHQPKLIHEREREFELPPLKAIWITLQSAVQAFAMSQGAFELLAPYLLAITAVVVCLFRLALSM